MAKKPPTRKASPAGSPSKAKGTRKLPGVPPPEVDSPPQTQEAQFIFRGTVVQRGAATLAQITDTENTIVVLVEEVLHAPDALKDFQGQHVTVKMGAGQE